MESQVCVIEKQYQFNMWEILNIKSLQPTYIVKKKSSFY